MKLVLGCSNVLEEFHPLPLRINQGIDTAEQFDTHCPRKALGTRSERSTKISENYGPDLPPNTWSKGSKVPYCVTMPFWDMSSPAINELLD